MDKRIPIAILVVLFIVALIYRLTNPPPPTPPGPNGGSQSWRSSVHNGDMVAQAVSPDATCWAGGWVKKTERGQQTTYRSALRILSFGSTTDLTVLFSPPRQNGCLAGITWLDNSTIAVLLNDNDTTSPTASSLALVDATSGSIKSETRLAAPVYRFLGLVGKTGQIACVTPDQQGMHLGFVGADGRLDTKKPVLPFKQTDLVGRIFAASPGGRYLVAFIDTDKPEGRTPIYYLLESDTGNARPIFDYSHLPSRVETICVSDTGEALVVCRAQDKPEVFSVLPGALPSPKPADIRKRWPDCPKELLFVSVKYIYSYDPATDKRTVLAELKNDSQDRERIVEEAQEGTAYRLGQDQFVTISTVSNDVDIRTFSKKGIMERAILPRQ